MHLGLSRSRSRRRRSRSRRGRRRFRRGRSRSLSLSISLFLFSHLPHLSSSTMTHHDVDDNEAATSIHAETDPTRMQLTWSVIAGARSGSAREDGETDKALWLSDTENFCWTWPDYSPNRHVLLADRLLILCHIMMGQNDVQLLSFFWSSRSNG